MIYRKAEYIWVGGDGELRSKTRIFKNYSGTPSIPEVNSLSNLPVWNYDGSSTNQAPGNDSEVLLKPRAIYLNPFVSIGYGNALDSLVLCDTWLPDGSPHETNTRHIAENIFNEKANLEPWFGMEQEFFVIDVKTGKPLGFPSNGNPAPQGPYYCSVGAGNTFGREFFEEVEFNCAKARVTITGKNYEVCPGQMEIQVMNEGIKAADDLLMLRYILQRTGEKYGYIIDFNPKPVKGDWNGSGCHTNFSTKPMREEGGYNLIIDAIKKLEVNHKKHIDNYGSGNSERLTGLHETAHIDRFTYGVANRGASVRIPRDTEKNQKGYLEDRRPSSNCDPYKVTSLIFSTCCS